MVPKQRTYRGRTPDLELESRNHVEIDMFWLAQGALDTRVSGAIITASECSALLAAMVIVLSMIGVNVSGLLLPAGIALAFAAKDLSHNFLAGESACTYLSERFLAKAESIKSEDYAFAKLTQQDHPCASSWTINIK